MKPDFLLSSFEEMKAHIENELRETIAYHYEARLILQDRIFTFEFMGHSTPYERLGEIIFEFEHLIEYMIPEQYRPDRSVYQDIIDRAIENLNRSRIFLNLPIKGYSYPGIIIVNKDIV